VFENPTLAAGTLAVAKAMAESDATTVIGGGLRKYLQIACTKRKDAAA